MIGRKIIVAVAVLLTVTVSIYAEPFEQVPEELILNYHLMHPGGDSGPGDPNAAFYLDGTYHLHYILRHPWKGKRSFSFVHVTSPDMLHWTWQKTKLHPSFTGHGMFSGTGFITKEGKPAAIYHGQGSGRNHIVTAKDRNLSAWEKPYTVEVRTADGKELEMRHWDPDCFLIGDVYYAISGGKEQPLFKSTDLKNWIYVGPFLKHELPDVVLGEDISCPNFFPIGDKWMLLCISHSYGCRYYLGDWEAEAEQFVPETHGRMNWPREGQDLGDGIGIGLGDFFAPESVLTPDGRRVMWAWLATIDKLLGRKTIQSLPRELSLGDDGALRIRPLRELEALRRDPVIMEHFTVTPPRRWQGGIRTKRITELNGDALEIRITVDRKEANRKQFGFRLFTGEDAEGLPIVLQPASDTLRVGTTEAPFAVADLPEGEDVELRIFIDKYLVEVFANGRQAMVAAHMDWRSARGLDAYTFGAPTVIKKVEIWRLKPTNEGLLKARESGIWLEGLDWDESQIISGPGRTKRAPKTANKQRDNLAATADNAASATGVSGMWIFDIESSLGAGSATFTFEQEGEKLTGQYQGVFGEKPVTGTVKGNEIKFSFPVNVAGQDETIFYFGTVERNSMKGEVEYGEDGAYGTGSFMGERE